MKPLLLLFGLCGLVSASRAAGPENQIVLEIPSTAEHPRNSESSFVTLKSGRVMGLYGRFFGGASDFSPASLATIESDDRGLTWSPPRTFMDRGQYLHVSSPTLLRLASGKIALIYSAKKGGLDCHPLFCLSSDEGATWSKSRPVIAAPGYFVLNNDRMIQTQSGRLIVTVAYNRALLPVDSGAHANDVRGIILWYYSDDEGATWHESPTWWSMPIPSDSGLQEPGVVELADRSLFAFARSSVGQFGFRSRDDGAHWTPPEATELISPASPASIKRLPHSADLLALFNDHSGRFAYPKGRSPYSGRSPLVAAISHDGGKTWPSRKRIEGDPNRDFCYAAIHFVGDSVLLAYNASKVGSPHLGVLRIRRISQAWLTAP